MKDERICLWVPATGEAQVAWLPAGELLEVEGEVGVADQVGGGSAERGRQVADGGRRRLDFEEIADRRLIDEEMHRAALQLAPVFLVVPGGFHPERAEQRGERG